MLSVTVDGDSDSVAAAISIRDRHCYRVDRLGIIIKRGKRVQLACCALDAKCRCIGAAEGIGERVLIRIGSGNGCADGGAGRRILGDRAGGTVALGEDGCVVGDAEGDTKRDPPIRL